MVPPGSGPAVSPAGGPSVPPAGESALPPGSGPSVRPGSGPAVAPGSRLSVPPGSGPTVRRILLGSQLRRLREARGIARDAAGRHWDIAQQNARMHREVVDSLFALLDQGLAINLPGEILRFAAGDT